MSEERFEKLDQLEGGEQIRIHFSGDKATVAGIDIESPLETTVRYITKQRLDSQKGDDVDGIVTKKEIFLEVPDHDDVRGEYLIETRKSFRGEKRVRPIEAREYFKGRPSDGTYSMHSLGFSDIEVID